MKIFQFAILTSLLLSFHSQAGEESFIDLRYEEYLKETAKANAQAQPQSASVSCPVVIATPHDGRLNQETLGTTFRDNPIISKRPATEWFQEALLNLKKLGVNATLEKPGQPVSNATLLSTDISKMYLWNHGMNLHATLVVKAKIQHGDSPEVYQNYRVIGTKLNWANGDSEFVSTLNIAASRLLEQIASDIQSQCGGKSKV